MRSSMLPWMSPSTKAGEVTSTSLASASKKEETLAASHSSASANFSSFWDGISSTLRASPVGRRRVTHRQCVGSLSGFTRKFMMWLASST